MEKAKRNRTIDTSVESGSQYLSRCIHVTQPQVDTTQILNKTIIGDTLCVSDLLPPKCFDLIIADPPYNLTKNFNGNIFSKTSRSKYEQYTEAWISKVAPLLKDTGSIYVCCDWESGMVIAPVLQEYFVIRNRITWQREKGRGAKSNWKNSMEDIWFATKGAQYTFNSAKVKTRKKVIAPYRIDGKPKDWIESEFGNYRDTFPSNFWADITVPFWSMPENTAHPTQKPEKLLAKLILASSNEGDLIFDPFLGSGTTSVAAKKLHRNYVGIEQNLQYCVWTEQRLEMAEKDSSIQGLEDGVFWERNSLSEQKKKK